MCLLQRKKHSWKVKWGGALCSGYWNLTVQMEKLLAFIGKNEFNSFCVLRASRGFIWVITVGWGSTALNTDSEQLREGLLLWLLHESQLSCLSCISIFCSHSWLSAVMWQSEVACNIIIYYTHDTELCTYSPALWLKPLLLTLTFPSCSDTAEQRLDCCCEVWKPFWYNRTC